MQFVVIGRDGADEEALSRRMNAREAHLKNTGDHKDNIKMAVAILGDNGQMNGSVMVVDFPSREALDEWLDNEPYVKGDVWQDITVIPGKIAPAFMS